MQVEITSLYAGLVAILFIVLSVIATGRRRKARPRCAIAAAARPSSASPERGTTSRMFRSKRIIETDEKLEQARKSGQSHELPGGGRFSTCRYIFSSSSPPPRSPFGFVITSTA